MSFIRLRNVSVNYPIFDVKGRSIRHDLVRISIGGLISTEETVKHVEVTAMRDVSLEIAAGDRVGVVGHNGAGKTTLLRVISGVFEPLHGHVEIEGHVVPLIDVMVGMDPELTGFDNIRLRGLFLGMSAQQIEALVPDVVAFSDLGNFLSMPVRTYSAGMRTRLGFAIATAVTPDILVLDEMIGAGDASFMERARKRLHDLFERASILVLASHDESNIRRFCNKAILMHHGKLLEVGGVDQIMTAYAQLSR